MSRLVRPTALMLLAIAPPCALAMVATNTDLTAVKSRLRSTLAAHDYSTKATEVVSVLDEVVKLNPTPFPARSSALLGNWRQINAPEYPAGLGRDEGTGEFRYTLGRLSFNIFEPKDLVCNIGATLNPLSAVEGSEEIDYKITVPLSFEASGKRVRGELVNTASCAAESDERVCVRFTGGTLRCVDTADIDAWKAMFGKGEAEEEAASKPGWRKRVTTWLLNRLLGLQPPGPMDEDGSMSYSMSRSPKGFLEVLFVDDELRITRGNKGSLVIAERIPSA